VWLGEGRRGEKEDHGKKSRKHRKSPVFLGEGLNIGETAGAAGQVKAEQTRMS